LIAYHNGTRLLRHNSAPTERVIRARATAEQGIQDDLRSQYRRVSSLHTEALIQPLTASLSSLIMESLVTGFFDEPWVGFFTELFFATCPHGVRVVFSTREARAWARSRLEHHEVHVCPFVRDPRLLDPFSLVQCAAFAQRFHATETQTYEWSVTMSGNGPYQSSLPVQQINETSSSQLPATGAELGLSALANDRYDFGALANDTLALAAAMHKYGQYVRRLVPADLLLQVDFFSSSLLRPAGDSSGQAWTALESALIAAFVRSA